MPRAGGAAAHRRQHSLVTSDHWLPRQCLWLSDTAVPSRKSSSSGSVRGTRSTSGISMRHGSTDVLRTYRLVYLSAKQTLPDALVTAEPTQPLGPGDVNQPETDRINSTINSNAKQDLRQTCQTDGVLLFLILLNAGVGICYSLPCITMYQVPVLPTGIHTAVGVFIFGTSRVSCVLHV